MKDKICVKCGEIKSISSFVKSNGYEYGLTNLCKKCKNETQREWRLKNKEYVKKSAIEYRLKNLEHFLKLERAAHFRHKKKRNAYSKQYAVKNKEAISVRTKKQRLKDKDKISERQKKYRSENRIKLIGKSKKYRDILCDGYVTFTLGVHVTDCPTELIQLKREQLKLYRATQ